MKQDSCGFSILGGDMRQFYLSKILEEHGYQKTSLQNASLVILPIPYEKSGKIWGMPPRTELTLDGLLSNLQQGCTLFGGCMPSSFINKAQARGVYCYDFMDDELMAYENTIAAAEGVIAQSILLTSCNLTNCSVLVLGYGRCGSTLVSMLESFHCQIFVYEKEKKTAARAHLHAKHLVSPKELPIYLNQVDLIINTVPALLLTDSLLDNVKSTTPILDIASLPGGVDYSAARAKNIHAHHLLGLPGKYSPLTSAQILYDSIMRTWKKRE